MAKTDSATGHLELRLPKNEIEALLRVNILKENKQAERAANDNAALTRAISWLTTHACAFITAWRSGKERTRKQNDECNSELAATLRSYGYGVTKVRGCYTEIGKCTSRENSFLVVNHTLDDAPFYNHLMSLAEKYNQDSFLYIPKSLNNKIDARLIFTHKKREKSLGTLHIGTLSHGDYSEIGSGTLYFRE